MGLRMASHIAIRHVGSNSSPSAAPATYRMRGLVRAPGPAAALLVGCRYSVRLQFVPLYIKSTDANRTTHSIRSESDRSEWWYDLADALFPRRLLVEPTERRLHIVPRSPFPPVPQANAPLRLRLHIAGATDGDEFEPTWRMAMWDAILKPILKVWANSRDGI